MCNNAVKPITQDDIMYQDNLVCILRPDVKKGIIILTNYTKSLNKESLCKLGLKSGKQLQKEGIDFGKIIFHSHIFFRAPYLSGDIDYSTIETEIISSFGEELVGEKNKVFIRVDPDKTYVYSSEIRNIFRHTKWIGKVECIDSKPLSNSKKTLSIYLTIIKYNLMIKEDIETGMKIWYNLFTSYAVLLPIRASPQEPFDNNSINRNSEILVSIPHLTSEYFVLCT